MNSDVVMHYPSVPTAYYATGQWAHDFEYAEEKKDRRTLGAFKVIKETSCSHLVNKLSFNGKHLMDDPRTFYCNIPISFNGELRSLYWKQAPIPANEQVIERFPRITNNSGKFLIFVDSGKIEALWQKFLKAYQEGRLGYGLQCATSVPNPNALDKDPVLVVFTEDSFNLPEVARVAWEIDKILGEWQGVLQFMTDRSTKAKSARGCNNELSMLYSISSFSFIHNAKGGGKTKETLQDFTSKFRYRFKPMAQARQDSLKMKTFRTIQAFDPTFDPNNHIKALVGKK